MVLKHPVKTDQIAVQIVDDLIFGRRFFGSRVVPRHPTVITLLFNHNAP